MSCMLVHRVSFSIWDNLYHLLEFTNEDFKLSFLWLASTIVGLVWVGWWWMVGVLVQGCCRPPPACSDPSWGRGSRWWVSNKMMRPGSGWALPSVIDRLPLHCSLTQFTTVHCNVPSLLGLAGRVAAGRSSREIKTLMGVAGPARPSPPIMSRQIVPQNSPTGTMWNTGNIFPPLGRICTNI